jgi:hypothetical protein
MIVLAIYLIVVGLAGLVTLGVPHCQDVCGLL